MIIIPDIHGREFWKEAVTENEQERIVFLGDYMDMYPDEEISYEDAVANFDEIIALKQKHPDNVVLLVGNHDISYMTDRDWARVRFDAEHCYELSGRFSRHRDLFQLAYQETINGKRYLFSHAGITGQFLGRCGIRQDCDNLARTLNNLFKADSTDFFNALGMISWWRGGYDEFGSMVWADVREYGLEGTDLVGDYQIFGHTWLAKPVITDKFACLDCCHCFTLQDGKPLFLNK